MEFTAEQIYGVVEKLVGKIRPEGESNEDKIRLKNLETFIAIFNKMHIEIDDIAYQYSNRQEFSIKAIGQRCKKHLDSMGIPE